MLYPVGFAAAWRDDGFSMDQLPETVLEDTASHAALRKNKRVQFAQITDLHKSPHADPMPFAR